MISGSVYKFGWDQEINPETTKFGYRTIVIND
jgi:hypothetical protein